MLKLFTTDTLQNNPLSNREEQLLSKFYDGETSPYETPEACLLLSRSYQARFYLKCLRKISITVKQIFHPYYLDTAGDNAATDLWDRILARLDQEIGPKSERSEHCNLGLQYKRCDFLLRSEYLH